MIRNIILILNRLAPEVPGHYLAKAGLNRLWWNPLAWFWKTDTLSKDELIIFRGPLVFVYAKLPDLLRGALGELLDLIGESLQGLHDAALAAGRPCPLCDTKPSDPKLN